MTEQARLAAALHWSDCGCSEDWPTPSVVHDQTYLGRASLIIAADPTLICPDPADHALAQKVRSQYPLLVLALGESLNPAALGEDDE